jgi:hypothetical protein
MLEREKPIISKLKALNVGDWGWIPEDADEEALEFMYDVLETAQRMGKLDLETEEGIDTLITIVSYFETVL